MREVYEPAGGALRDLRQGYTEHGHPVRELREPYNDVQVQSLHRMRRTVLHRVLGEAQLLWKRRSNLHARRM